MNKGFPRGFGWVLAAVLLAGGGALGEIGSARAEVVDPKTPAVGTSPSGPTMVLPKWEPRPGFIRGRVVDELGKPLDPKLTSARVTFIGEIGSPTQVSVPVKPDEHGRFEIPVTAGFYRSNGTIETTVAGQIRWFELHPVQDNLTDQDSRKGVVQDYVWKLTGRRPGASGKPGEFTHWYGGSIHMTADIKANEQPPTGAQWIFTLTPKGRLPDGREARELTITQPSANPAGLLNRYPVLYDLPPTDYRITGREVNADGSSRPLRMFHAASDKDVDALDVVFGSGYHGHGILPYTMFIHRPMK